MVRGGINSLSKGTIDAMMADKNTSIYDLIGIGNIRKKISPSDIDGENRHADSDR